jgi:hypothetical protein
MDSVGWKYYGVYSRLENLKGRVTVLRTFDGGVGFLFIMQRTQ